MREQACGGGRLLGPSTDLQPARIEGHTYMCMHTYSQSIIRGACVTFLWVDVGMPSLLTMPNISEIMPAPVQIAALAQIAIES